MHQFESFLNYEVLSPVHVNEGFSSLQGIISPLLDCFIELLVTAQMLPEGLEAGHHPLS